jgi:hypothetical protein
MLVTILLPEFILAHAIMELNLAIVAMKHMKRDSFFARGRGHIKVVYPAWLTLLMDSPNRWPVIRSMLGRKKPVDGLADEEQQRRSGITPSGQSQKHPSHVLKWTLTHAYFANMGGFVFSPRVDELELSNPGPLTGQYLARLITDFDFPNITEGDIKDKSKTDGLAKAFSVFQISHLVLSLIVRRSQGLPSSQLEILTLAFAICGVVTYAIYWYKPKDVAVPVRVGLKETRDDESVLGIAHLPTFDSFWRVVTNNKDHRSRPPSRVPNDNIPLNRLTGFAHTATFLLAFVSAAFASLHAIAWDFDFPTAAEATIWHVCTILTITLPPLGLLGIPLSQSTWHQGDPRDFLFATIRVLRELSWQLDSAEDKKRLNDIRYLLDVQYTRDFDRDLGVRSFRMPYEDYLWSKAHPEYHLRQKMLDFVDKKEKFQNRPDLDLPPGYSSNLHRLFRLIDGHGSKKMVDEVARVGVFPRRSLLPTAFNKWLVYITMGLYCAARLVLVAVGFSSMRAMPQGVYKSTWADYFPAI